MASVLPGRSISVRLIVLAVLLAACSPGTGPGESPVPTQSAHELECEREAFPCSNEAVPQAIRDTTAALADEAAQRLGDTPPADVATWLDDQEGVVETWSSELGVRFRLDGGRPASAWTAPEVALASEPDPQPVVRSTGERVIDAVPVSARLSGPPRPGSTHESVVGTDPDHKRALIISPFAYVKTGAGSKVADIFSQTRGYEGGVTYLANGSRGATTVSVDTFRHLDGNGIIYVQTMGGSVCNDRDECHPVIAINEIASEAALPPGTGVELIAWRNKGVPTGTFGVALGEDFFFANYPAAIEHALIYFDVPDILDENLYTALVGGSSEWYFWDGVVSIGEASRIAIEYLGALAETGRTTHQVFDAMRPRFTVGDAHLIGIRPDVGILRVREIVALLDPNTGEPLADGGSVEVVGNLGDGEPDKIHWSVGIDGIGPPDLTSTSISVVIDGVVSDAYLPGDGEQVAEDAYRLEGELQMDRDLSEGDVVEVRAVAQLADTGLSEQTLMLKVAADELGQVWKGTFSVSTTYPNSVFPTLTGTMEFTRVASSKPDARYVRFKLTGGTLTWKIHGSSRNCDVDGGPEEYKLQPDDSSEILFDTSGESGHGIVYSAHAALSDGKVVTVKQSCANGEQPYTTHADGTFWLAPPEENWEVTGDTISGTYRTASAISTVFVWELHRVR